MKSVRFQVRDEVYEQVNIRGYVFGEVHLAAVRSIDYAIFIRDEPWSGIHLAIWEDIE